jgi:peptidoglycan L-alanyl-D-glutamate endopeptidase CwlK
MEPAKCKDLEKLTPETKVFCELWLSECKKAGLDLVILETYRSNERQLWLYAQGRTRPGTIVTNLKVPAMHGAGLAFDFAMKENGQITFSNTTLYDKALDIGEKIGLFGLRPFERSHLENRNSAPIIPDWAVSAKKKADAKNINYGNILSEVSAEKFQSILFQLGIIEKIGELPTYRLLTILEKLNKL